MAALCLTPTQNFCVLAQLCFFSKGSVVVLSAYSRESRENSSSDVKMMAEKLLYAHICAWPMASSLVKHDSCCPFPSHKACLLPCMQVSLKWGRGLVCWLLPPLPKHRCFCEKQTIREGSAISQTSLQGGGRWQVPQTQSDFHYSPPTPVFKQYFLYQQSD